MPLDKTAFGRTVLLLFGLGLGALLLITGASLWLVDRTTDYASLVTATQQTRVATSRLLTLLTFAESGQRGYLLTGDHAYLQPYTQAQGAIPTVLATLAARTEEEPETGRAVRRLAELANEKMGELADTVRLYDAGQHQEALALVGTDRGRVLMEEARALLGTVLARLDARIAAGSLELRRSERALTAVSVAGAVAILLLAAGAVWLVRVYMRVLERARREVEAVNAGLESRVRERTAALEQANEEVQRFAYIVSHDLRAPLVNVMGFTAELEIGAGALRELVDRAEAAMPDLVGEEARLAAREDLPEAIGFIRSSTERMDRLINAILRISREGRRTLTPEPIRMEGLLEGLAASVQHQIAEGGGELRIRAPVPDLVADRMAVEQVFGNLIDNAVKYLDPSRPGRIEIRGRREGLLVVYEVEDNGRGIAPRDHERIFELFRRAGAQDRPGEGIGLAHVRAALRRLGGAIDCESEPGQGSVFRVTLPAAPVAAPSFQDGRAARPASAESMEDAR